MPVFEVLVNGTCVCTARVEGSGSLSAIVDWRGGASGSGGPPLSLYVGGFEGQSEELVKWAVPTLQLGDEVTVRTMESAESDAPAERECLDPARLRAEQETYVRQMAAEWGWEIREGARE
jgi:hypothetical protein